MAQDLPDHDQQCLGPAVEYVTEQHDHPAAVVTHITLFLAHRSAQSLMDACGVTAINRALLELPTTEDLHSPAGWLTWRARQLAAGAPPQPSHRGVSRLLKQEESRREHLQGYYDKYGGQN